jgi:nucleotide sugar dehydrogenase
MRIAVVALGKIGLPLAVQFARRGHEVVGADVAEHVVGSVNAAVAPFPGEAGLDDQLRQVVDGGLLRATTDTTAAAQQAEVVVLVVPLFVDAEGRPGFDALDDATRAVGAGLQPGSLVSYETTLPVGTTRNRWLPMLEQASGMRCGDDFSLAFSPERVLTGRVFSDLRRYPKLVGGVDPESTKAAAAFYESVLEFDDRPDLDRPNGVWALERAETAELVKLAETTYRDVNIGLANEFLRFAVGHGIDMGEVVTAANSQPYSHLHNPGISVGGHCIPVYPWLYLAGDPAAATVRAARASNAGMPGYAVGLLEGEMGGLRDVEVVVLGAAYRAGAKETAFSGVFPLVRGLTSRGAQVRVHDPMFTDDELVALGLRPYHRGETAAAVVLHTAHPDYAGWAEEDVPGVSVLLDGRGTARAEAWPTCRRLVIGVSG